jgi:hypothetical protein
MVRKVRGLQVTAVLALLIGSGQQHVPAQELPPTPVPVLPAPTALEGPVTPPLRPPVPPPPYSLIPMPVMPPASVGYPMSMPYQDRNGPLLQGDPLLDRPGAQPPGWFAGVELNLVGAHIKNHLSAPVTIEGFLPDMVHLPSAELDWAGSPRFELGYRLGQGFGEFLVSYRFLATEGRAVVPDFDVFGAAFLKSRLDLHVLDLDYASQEFGLLPHWEMRWKVGARLASVFFDSRATGLFLEQRTSNYFFGGGPHAGLDLCRPFGGSGLAFFGRLDGAVVIGRIHQSFEETALFNDGLVGGATLLRGSQAVPILNLQAGLNWTPPYSDHLRLTFGYQFQYWWSLGEAAGSSAELSENGIFFRGEWHF